MIEGSVLFTIFYIQELGFLVFWIPVVGFMLSSNNWALSLSNSLPLAQLYLVESKVYSCGKFYSTAVYSYKQVIFLNKFLTVSILNFCYIQTEGSGPFVNSFYCFFLVLLGPKTRFKPWISVFSHIESYITINTADEFRLFLVLSSVYALRSRMCPEQQHSLLKTCEVI